MGLRSIFTPWKHTRGWLRYELAILNFLADEAGDNTFSDIVRRQVEGVFEVRRKRIGPEYESWPAFFGGLPCFPTHRTVETALIDATSDSGRVQVRVLLGGGMVAKLLIRGDRLPRPPSINVRNLQLAQFKLPEAPVLPEARGWVAEFIQEGLLERLEPPLPQEERTNLLETMPPLPKGYLEFCAQSEGGVAAPASEQFDIFGLADISIATLSDGREFVPLVNMREFGGLAALPGEPNVVLIDGDTIEAYAPTFEEALRRLASEYGAA